jgi:hypothetical protein
VTVPDLMLAFYHGVTLLVYVALRVALVKALAGVASVGIVSKVAVRFRRRSAPESSKT